MGGTRPGTVSAPVNLLPARNEGLGAEGGAHPTRGTSCCRPHITSALAECRTAGSRGTDRAAGGEADMSLPRRRAAPLLRRHTAAAERTPSLGRRGDAPLPGRHWPSTDPAAQNGDTTERARMQRGEDDGGDGMR